MESQRGRGGRLPLDARFAQYDSGLCGMHAIAAAKLPQNVPSSWLYSKHTPPLHAKDLCIFYPILAAAFLI